MTRLLRAICAAALFLTGPTPTVAAPATLVPLPQAAETFVVGTLHVARYGNGPNSVIFIPGLASGPWEWAREISQLAQRYSVYALTLPGFDGMPYTIEGDPFVAFSNDFWTLLDTHKVVRPAVIGHSLGGTLAIALAEQHPDRLRGILALDGLPVLPMLAQDDAAARRQAAQKVSAQISDQTHDQVVVYEQNYMRQIGTLNASLVEPTAALEARSDPKAIAAWLSADFEHDSRPGLARITIPFVELMPYAQPSPYTQAQTLAFYQSLVAGAPHVSVVPIPNARHFAMLDQPQAVDDAMAQFLAQAFV